MTDDLTCKELVEIITVYLEDAMPVEDRARFEGHLAGCGGCTNYLAQMRETIRLSGMMSEDDITPQAKSELLSVFRDWKQEKN